MSFLLPVALLLSAKSAQAYYYEDDNHHHVSTGARIAAAVITVVAVLLILGCVLAARRRRLARMGHTGGIIGVPTTGGKFGRFGGRWGAHQPTHNVNQGAYYPNGTNAYPPAAGDAYQAPPPAYPGPGGKTEEGTFSPPPGPPPAQGQYAAPPGPPPQAHVHEPANDASPQNQNQNFVGGFRA
ncbi:hypothetical protein MKEN_00302100 [Mycena kentingensis (nom. inval.)]|nr:hypothetical protein MKEN_00302100 [Mycena kentingensis (nom. inval.)]